MLPNDDWTDLEPDRVQSGRGFPGEDDEQEDLFMQGLRDDVARGLDDGWSQVSRTVTVDTALVAGVSASKITKQEVLADQQHRVSQDKS